LSDIQKELIRSCMRHMVFLELEIEQLDKRIAELIQASQQQVPCQLLQTIPGCRAPEFLGRGLPRQPRERRQAQEPAHHARQPVVPRHADRVRLGRLAQEGKRLAGQVPAAQTSDGPQASPGRGGPRAGASHPLCAGYWSALSRTRAGGVQRVPATTADPPSHPAPSPPGLLAPGGKAHPFKGLVRLSLPPLPRSASRPTSRSQAEVLPSSSPRRGPVMTLEHGNCFQNNTDKHRWKRVVLSAFIGVNPRLKRY